MTSTGTPATGLPAGSSTRPVTVIRAAGSFFRSSSNVVFIGVVSFADAARALNRSVASGTSTTKSESKASTATRGRVRPGCGAGRGSPAAGPPAATAAPSPARPVPRATDAEAPGDLQQVPGVIAGSGAGQQDDVVAGALALDPHPTRGEPGQRVEPVQSAGRRAMAWVRQSSRWTCASSCRRTSRRRSAASRVGLAGSRTTGRSQPQVIGMAARMAAEQGHAARQAELRRQVAQEARSSRRRRSAGLAAPAAARRSGRSEGPPGSRMPRPARSPSSQATTGEGSRPWPTAARMRRSTLRGGRGKRVREGFPRMSASRRC